MESFIITTSVLLCLGRRCQNEDLSLKEPCILVRSFWQAMYRVWCHCQIPWDGWSWLASLRSVGLGHVSVVGLADYIREEYFLVFYPPGENPFSSFHIFILLTLSFETSVCVLDLGFLRSLSLFDA